MAQKAVVDAVAARLAASWTRCPVYGVNEGRGETPADGSPFLVPQFPVASVERLPVSQRFYRETGGIRFVLHTQAGAGTEPALTWAGELAALFRDQTFAGVITQAPSSPFIDNSNDRAGYFVTTIVVPYTFNFSD